MYVYTVASDCLCVLFNVVLFIVKNILFTTNVCFIHHAVYFLCVYIRAC